ncbi:MAG: hypothetical protein HZC55_21250 [Verrucomicrobia bacterium]|nr:hypothetical protein [Verrucomicrobiota bacterium]
MKKNTTKATSSPAPATKAVPAKSPAKKKAASAPAAKTPARSASTAAAPLPKPVSAAPAVTAEAPRPAPVQSVVARPVQTTISARIDVGFGNTLYLRGEGAGLSWDAGVPMECLADDHWQIILGESARGVTFKFLINDVTWSVGADYTQASGTTASYSPQF